MKTIRTMMASLLVVLATTTAYAEPVKTVFETRVGKLEFVNSFPTQETTDKLREARRFHKAYPVVPGDRVLSALAGSAPS